jgi:predicted nucleic acid-binding protein
VHQFVIDASVGVLLYVRDALTPRAYDLFAHLASPQPALLHVPDLFYAECLGALRKHALRFGYTNLTQDVLRLHALSLSVTPCTDLLIDACDISMAHGISSYDGFYVALSARVGAPLITADERLAHALRTTPYNFHTLATYDIPLVQ